MKLSFTTDYIAEATQILAKLDVGSIERTVDKLVETRRRDGRVFFLGANLWSVPLLLSESLRPGGDLRRAWRELAR